MSYSLEKREIYLILKNIPNEKSLERKKEILLDKLLNKFKLSKCENAKKTLKDSLRLNFLNNYKKRWNKLSKNNKNFEVFEKKNINWLNSQFTFKICDDSVQDMIDNQGKYLVFIIDSVKKGLTYADNFCSFVKNINIINININI